LSILNLFKKRKQLQSFDNSATVLGVKED